MTVSTQPMELKTKIKSINPAISVNEKLTIFFLKVAFLKSNLRFNNIVTNNLIFIESSG